VGIFPSVPHAISGLVRFACGLLPVCLLAFFAAEIAVLSFQLFPDGPGLWNVSVAVGIQYHAVDDPFTIVPGLTVLCWREQAFQNVIDDRSQKENKE
jgi:hypothetical protein